MGIQEELTDAALEAAIQGTYVAQALDRQPLPATTILPLKGRGRTWIKLEHAAVSIMRHNKFTATFQYYSAPDGVGEHPSLNASPRTTLLVRGLYRVKGNDILFKPHPDAHPKLPRNVHAQYVGGTLWIGYEITVDSAVHQATLTLHPHRVSP